MLPVLHLDPVLRPAALIRPVAALRHQAFEAHLAGSAEEVGTDLALFERPDIFSMVKRPHQADPRQHRRAAHVRQQASTSVLDGIEGLDLRQIKMAWRILA